jgi:DNA-directed RNA polymerase
MVLPYGGTRQAFQTYIREDFESRVAAGEHNPFAGEEGMAVIHLANIMWKAVGEVVVAARAVMDSLRSLSRAATKHTQPIKWITPIGFPCHQAYIKMDERRVKTQLGGSLVYFRVHEQTDKLDGSRQANGVSPNFVHSLDAAHLMFTVLAAQREGIESFHLVHDSYGTLAADASALSRILREQFVSMYEQYRPLEHLWSMVRDSLPSDAKLPEVPGEGTFDLRQVLESPYFFG